MAQAARCRLWQGARARAVGMGGRHGTGRRLAGRVRWRVVGVTLRAEGGFAGGVGAGGAAAWLCRCTYTAYPESDEQCCCFDVVADGAVLVCVCFVCWAHAVMIMMMAT